MKTNLKLALKVLARRKFFTFISLFGISMTLVVLMVVSAVLDNFLAPRSPESRFDRVLAIYTLSEEGMRGGAMQVKQSSAGYSILQQQLKTLPDIERAAIFSNPQTVTIYRGKSTIEATLKHTDADYWRILDFHFIGGRPYTDAEDANGSRVAVITRSIAAQLFGSTNAIGRRFDLDSRTFQVVGVVDDPSVTRVAAFSKIWLPIGTIESSTFRHEVIGDFCGLVLAHSRADFPRLKREFQTRLRKVPVEDPRLFSEYHGGLDTTFEAAARIVTRNHDDNRGPMILGTVFVVAALLFMTLPALNLVTLNLSRILERASEIGVRKAFGAARPALVGQFVTENIVLTVIGGVIGFVMATIALQLITSSGVIPNAQFDVNLRIFGWGMLITVVFGLLSGVYPAWRMSRLDPVNALRGGAL